MEHHQDNDVSARASNKLPNEQLGLWVIQMHYWELQPVVNQSSRRKMSGNSELPFYPWVFLLITEAEAPSSLPAQDQCPELSFLLRFQWASYPVQSRIFKHLKSRRQIKPPSILVIWEQNGVLFMIFVPRLFSQCCCTTCAVLFLNLHNKYHHHPFPKVIFTFLPSPCSLIQRKVDEKITCL